MSSTTTSTTSGGSSSTGFITSSIIDALTSTDSTSDDDVKRDWLEQLWYEYGNDVILFFINLAIAIVILFFGIKLSGVISRWIARVAEKQNIDLTIVGFFETVVKQSTRVIVILVALGQLGFDSSNFFAILASLTFALAFALQGSLSNFAAGVILLFLRPFKTGDRVNTGGIDGFVLEVGMFQTTLVLESGSTVRVDNMNITANPIYNHMVMGQTRISLEIGIAYSDSIKLARETLLDILCDDPRVFALPQPSVVVTELGDNAVILSARCWVLPEIYYDVRFDFIERIKLRFDEVGLHFPFPQVDQWQHADPAIVKQQTLLDRLHEKLDQISNNTHRAVAKTASSKTNTPVPLHTGEQQATVISSRTGSSRSSPLQMGPLIPEAIVRPVPERKTDLDPISSSRNSMTMIDDNDDDDDRHNIAEPSAELDNTQFAAAMLVKSQPSKVNLDTTGESEIAADLSRVTSNTSGKGGHSHGSLLRRNETRQKELEKKKSTHSTFLGLPDVFSDMKQEINAKGGLAKAVGGLLNPLGATSVEAKKKGKNVHDQMIQRSTRPSLNAVGGFELLQKMQKKFAARHAADSRDIYEITSSGILDSSAVYDDDQAIFCADESSFPLATGKKTTDEEREVFLGGWHELFFDDDDGLAGHDELNGEAMMATAADGGLPGAVNTDAVIGIGRE